MIDAVTADRFNAKHMPVPEGAGCWLWLGAVSQKGYGSMKVSGAVVGAHRLSWEMHSGPIPEGMHVLHKCDTPACVNPSHLFLGTNADNIEDKIKKGRVSRTMGERHWAAKLSDDQVREIRGAGGLHREIAKQYGVTRSVVGEIKSRRLWPHVV